MLICFIYLLFHVNRHWNGESTRNYQSMNSLSTESGDFNWIRAAYMIGLVRIYEIRKANILYK